MTQDNFWELIDSAWKASPEINKKRIKAIKNQNEEYLFELSNDLEDTILSNYNQLLLNLSKGSFTEFIHILEERLYNIDREDIHEYTDGSDDGFLYCRCFIVGMGKDYYQMIEEDPSKATMDVEAELFGFSAYQTY